MDNENDTLPRSNSATQVVDEGHRVLKEIVSKLSMADQLVLYRDSQLLPNVCAALWRKTHKRLDFRNLEQELQGEELSFFINQMLGCFKSVYFTANRVQENLNVLERAGVKALNGVQHCELLMPESLEERASGTGDAVPTPPTVSQWPLHALPKLLRNLRHLKVECNVQVHFIEQFAHLEILVLHGDISQTAMTGVLKRCGQLRRLFIKSDNVPLNLQGIRECKLLSDVVLPLTLFQKSEQFIVQLPHLQMLELSKQEGKAKLVIDCMRYVMTHKGADLDIIQVNCSCFKGVQWIRAAELYRCTRLTGLMLINCRFKDREISDLRIPPISKYLVLSGCLDMKEYQLVDIIKRCPGLSELYLIDCTSISGNVLHGIYNIRRSESSSCPLKVLLCRCDAINDAYKELFDTYWSSRRHYIIVECVPEKHHVINDIQLFFHKN